MTTPIMKKEKLLCKNHPITNLNISCAETDPGKFMVLLAVLELHW